MAVLLWIDTHPFASLAGAFIGLALLWLWDTSRHAKWTDPELTAVRRMKQEQRNRARDGLRRLP